MGMRSTRRSMMPIQPMSRPYLATLPAASGGNQGCSDRSLGRIVVRRGCPVRVQGATVSRFEIRTKSRHRWRITSRPTLHSPAPYGSSPTCCPKQKQPQCAGVFVEYRNLMDDWRGEVERISAALNIGLSTANGRAIDEFLTSALRHKKYSGPVADRFGANWISRRTRSDCGSPRRTGRHRRIGPNSRCVSEPARLPTRVRLDS